MSEQGKQAIRAYPTMISDLIRELQAILDEQGDMPVFTKAYRHCTAKVDVTTIPYYYDGGCLLPAVETEYHCKHWLRSTTHGHLYPTLCEISGDEPDSHWDEDPPERHDTIDSTPVKSLGSRAAYAATLAQRKSEEE